MANPDERDRLTDRIDIDDVLTRYATAIDNEQWDLLDAVFAPDARLDYRSAGGIRGSYLEVRSWLEEVLPIFELTQHLVLNRVVEFDDAAGAAPDRARVRSAFLNPNQLTVNGELWLFTVGGYYHDRFERTAEGWLITSRVEETSWWHNPMPGLPPRPYPLPEDCEL